MNTKTILGLLALIIALGGGWYYMNFQKYAPATYVTDTPHGQVTTDTVTGTTSTNTPKYLMTDVASHKDKTSCYSVVSGAVYDLTLWVNMHPGGKNPILSLCGHDGTKHS